jgi:hypothetical protein
MSRRLGLAGNLPIREAVRDLECRLFTRVFAEENND